MVVVILVLVDPPNGGNQRWVEIPTEDIALLPTVSARIFSFSSVLLLAPPGETTNPASWDSLLFGVALGGFINISPVSLELHPDAQLHTQ